MKKFLVAIIFGLSAMGALADPLLYWGSDLAYTPGGDAVLYTNGLAVVQDSNWLVELINLADDSVLHSTTSGFLAGAGAFFSAVDAGGWNGLNVKTVIYNAPTKEEAGLFAEFTFVGNLLWSMVPSPPAVFSYNAGSVSAELGSGPGQWQAIPEPAVSGLICLFSVALLSVKRVFKK